MGWVVPKVVTFLVTIVTILTLSKSASADPDPETPEDESEMIFETPLSTSLSAWSSAEEPLITLRELPQGRLNQRPPFMDFGNVSYQFYSGVASFSSSFKSRPQWLAGVGARVPVTGISKSVGLWGEVFISYMDRDIPFYYLHPSGNWMGFGVGADYELFKSEIAVLRAQVGAVYAWFRDIKAVDDGIGAELGLQLGFYWIKFNPISLININPQLITNGSDLIFLVTVGFEVQF